MHRRMMWGGHHGFEWPEMDEPAMTASVAMCAMIMGLIVGMVVGKKKAMMHGMMGRGMMGGMGHGGYGYPDDWMMRKKAMMGGMYGHHHHGYGGPPCFCQSQGQGAGMHEGPEKGEETES